MLVPIDSDTLVKIFLFEQSFFKYSIWAGALSALFVFYLNVDSDQKNRYLRWFLLGFAVFSFLPVPLYFLFNLYLLRVTTYQVPFPVREFSYWLGCFIGGIVVGGAWLRFMPGLLNRGLVKIQLSTALERNHKTDIRTIRDQLPDAIEYDPLQYINLDKGVFAGIGEDKQPIYHKNCKATSNPHIQICGTSGAGKGLTLGLLATQYLERGEAVIFMDPKFDEYAPSVMHTAANRTGKPYHFINLNRPNGSQFNPFAGATEEEIFELFQAGFGLTEKGDASDFYGIADRREAGITAKLMATKNYNIAQAYQERRSELEDKENGAEKFAGRLRELAETPSINANAGAGVDLEKVIKEGGCVYIVGSMRNDIVRTVQRMLLVRIIQLAERRDRFAGDLRPVCIVMDEVKYFLSRPALEGLGAARDKGVHIVLTHQSIGDLKDCPKDLNPDAVVDAIVENCKIKYVFAVINPVTAEWLAAMSGVQQADDESRHVRKNIMQAETVLPERMIRQAERYFMDCNTLRSLKPHVAVMYGDGLAKFVSIQPIRVEKNPQAVAIAKVPGTSTQTARDAIAL